MHEQIAGRDLAGGLAEQEPELVHDILFGAATCLYLDDLVGAHLLARLGRRASRRWRACDPPLPASRGAPTIVTCPDGPILVRGDVEIVDDSGQPVPRRRATVALCRCGASAIKPYCDGTHKAIGFSAP